MRLIILLLQAAVVVDPLEAVVLVDLSQGL
jgi:hypothetical protein